MQFSIITITALLAYVAAAPANIGFVHAPIKKQSLLDVQSKIPNFAASEPITVELYNEEVGYQVEFTLGGQTLKANIDTGSEFLWVWDTDSEACKANRQGCDKEGSYNPSKSSTSNVTGVPFDIQYMIGHSSGFYYTDDISIGGATASGFKFGVNSGNSTGGFDMVFGIGENGDNSSSISSQLQKSGAISRQLYGMYFSEAALSGTKDDNSEITFGAINTGRYSGSLKTVPRVPTPGYPHFSVTASSKFGDIDLFDNDLVVLDSGTTLTYLKSDAYNAFLGGLKDLGITLENYGGGWQAYPCSDNSKLKFTYNFGGKEITVTGDDLSFPGPLINSGVNSTTCFIGIADGKNQNLLGDSFLRATYTVYDLERDEISIAHVDHDKPDNYVVITGDVPN